MEDLPKLTNQLEFLFLKRIIEGFRERTIDFPTAQDLAKKFLEMEPFASFEDAKQKIGNFVRMREQFGHLAEFIDAFHTEQQKSVLIEKMRVHLKKGEIDQAIKIAQDK